MEIRLDLNDSAREIKAHILKGVPNENPTPPALTRNNLVYEISLAQITVKTNSATIAKANIIDERLNRSVCGAVSSQLDSQYVNLEDYTMDVVGFDGSNQPVEINYYTQNGILFEKVKLEDQDENDKYTSMYLYQYLEDGETVGNIKKWKLTYNANGFIIKKELVVV